jgi:hypothetical protein
MMLHELTKSRAAATPQGGARQGTQVKEMVGRLLLAIGLSAGLSGCINVTAPDQPIVIQLDINIRQEVIYRLAEDAANTIDENADIF